MGYVATPVHFICGEQFLTAWNLFFKTCESEWSGFQERKGRAFFSAMSGRCSGL